MLPTFKQSKRKWFSLHSCRLTSGGLTNPSHWRAGHCLWSHSGFHVLLKDTFIDSGPRIKTMTSTLRLTHSHMINVLSFSYKKQFYLKMRRRVQDQEKASGVRASLWLAGRIQPLTHFLEDMLACMWYVFTGRKEADNMWLCQLCAPPGWGLLWSCVLILSTDLMSSGYIYSSCTWFEVATCTWAVSELWFYPTFSLVLLTEHAVNNQKAICHSFKKGDAQASHQTRRRERLQGDGCL